MPGKMAGSDPGPSVRITEVLVAVSTSRLSCKRAGKTRTLMSVWDLSGEFGLISPSGRPNLFGNEKSTDVGIYGLCLEGVVPCRA